MKDFFKNKVNVLLVSLLVVLMLVAAFFLFSIFGPKDLKAINFSNLSEKEVLEWKTKNGVEDSKFTISYEFSEEVEKGYVVYQSVKENESIKDGITIVISNGSDPDLELELPSITNLSLEEVKKWLEDNKFTNYSFEYALKEDIAENMVIGFNRSGKVKRSDELIIKVSIGDNENAVITVPDFKEYSKYEIDQWAKDNKISVKYLYALSSNIASGKVIEQSIQAKTDVKIGSTISITISQGEGVALKDMYNMSKSEAEKWCKDNGLKVSFGYKESTKVKENYVVSTDPKAGTMVGEQDEIKIYLSKNKDMVKVEGNLLNKTEKDFIKLIEDLGLKVKKEDKTYFSTTISKGNIFSYDDGEFKKGDTIKYALSEGAFSFKADDFNNKAKADVNTLVKDLNDRNAHITIKFTEVDSTKYKNGTTFDCNGSKSGINWTISCSVAKNSSTVDTISVPNHVGKPNPCGGKNSCQVGGVSYSVEYRYDSKVLKGNVISQDKSGTQPKDTVVKLVVSNGTEQVKVEDYVGKKNPCSGNACTINKVSFSITYEFSDKAEGIVISQSKTGLVDVGTTIRLVVSKGQEVGEGYIDANYDIYVPHPTSFENTKNNVLSQLGNFKLSIIEVSPEDAEELSEGYIYQIFANGQLVDEGGTFPYTTEVIVKIVRGE